MKRRRRHAFLAVLVALFVLPVVKPEGFPGLEGWLDGALNWTSRLALATPRPTDLSETAGSSAEAVRARDLSVMILQQREELYRVIEETTQRIGLLDAIHSLDRLPLARAARVLRASDASPLRHSILIDLGADDGISEGLAVVQGGVFVGVVQRVEAHASRVQLVIDPSACLSLAIRTQEGARATGWLRTHGEKEPLSVGNLKAADGIRVRADDAVLTGNDNDLVPAGLVVGRVVSATDADADSVLDVRFRPLFDLVRTTTVLVLVPPK